MNKLVIGFLVAIYACVIGDFIADVTGSPLRESWDTFLVMGYAKAAITFVKYIP